MTAWSANQNRIPQAESYGTRLAAVEDMMKRRTKTPSKNIRIIRRYQLAQSMLEGGCTVQQLMAALSISDRQTRRVLDDFRAEGCRIESDFVLGQQSEAVFKLVGKFRVL